MATSERPSTVDNSLLEGRRSPRQRFPRRPPNSKDEATTTIAPPPDNSSMHHPLIMQKSWPAACPDPSTRSSPQYGSLLHRYSSTAEVRLASPPMSSPRYSMLPQQYSSTSQPRLASPAKEVQPRGHSRAGTPSTGTRQGRASSSQNLPLGNIPPPPDLEALMGMSENKRCIMSEAIVKSKKGGKARLDVSLWTDLHAQSGQGRDVQSRCTSRGSNSVWSMLKGPQPNLEAEAALVHYLRPSIPDTSLFCMPHARPLIESRNGFLHKLRISPPGSPERGHRPIRTSMSNVRVCGELGLTSTDSSPKNIAMIRSLNFGLSFCSQASEPEPPRPVVATESLREVKGDPDLIKKARRLKGVQRPSSVMLTEEDDMLLMASNFGILPHVEDEEPPPACASTAAMSVSRKILPGAVKTDLSIRFRSTLKSDAMAEATASKDFETGAPIKPVLTRTTTFAPKTISISDDACPSALAGGRQLLSSSTMSRQYIKVSESRRSRTGDVEIIKTVDASGLHGVMGNRTGKMARPSSTFAAQSRTASLDTQGVAFIVLKQLSDQLKNPRMTTAEVVAKVIKVETQDRKCRFTDLVKKQAMIGPPDFFISHAWSANFREMVSAVAEYLASRIPSCHQHDTYVWIDVLCANQHTETAQTIDPSYVMEVLQNCNQTLLIIDRRACSLSRTWCLWEMWMTMQSDRSDRGKLVTLPTTWDWSEMQPGFLLMTVDGSKTSCPRDRQLLMYDLAHTGLRNVVVDFKDAMLRHAKRELARADNVINVNPCWFAIMATTVSLLMAMTWRYSEAEDQIKVLDSALRRSAVIVPQKYILATKYHFAWLLREKGQLPDAERLMQTTMLVFNHMLPDELFLACMALSADLLSCNGSLSKGEMLCYKSLEEKESAFGKSHPLYVDSLIQLASMGASHKLNRQAEETATQALDSCEKCQISGRMMLVDSCNAASCMFILSQCAFNTNRLPESASILGECLSMLLRILHPDHPRVMEARMLQVTIQLAMHEQGSAREELLAICDGMERTWGPDHPEYIFALCQLADVERELAMATEAAATDKKILAIGKGLVEAQCPIDRIRSMSVITTFLADREHLLAKAAMLTAKVFVIYRSKLGPENKLTRVTRGLLSGIIDRVKVIAIDALNVANNESDPNGFEAQLHFRHAESMFRQAFTVGRLVAPDSDHSRFGQGLADTLFGQGKAHEAQKVLRSAGLLKGGAVPTSYLRFMNIRAMQAIQKHVNAAPEEEEKDEEEGDGLTLDF